MSGIFISYRRDDSEAITGRIYDRLKSEFGSERVTMDVDSIPPGADFREFLDHAVSRCDMLLVIMGSKWCSILHQRRDDPGDFVRIEVESALARKIPVIPILVGKTIMPREEELPSALQSLAYRNARTVDTGRDFHMHMERLIREVTPLLVQKTASPADRVSPPSSERQLIGHQGPILSLAVSVDGQFALSGAMDKTMRLWNLRARKEVGQFPGHEGNVNCVAFSPSGRQAISGDGHYKLHLWDVPIRKEIFQLQGHTRAVLSVAFSPDGKLALSGSKDGSVRLWDLIMGREIFCAEGHTYGVLNVGFFPKGDRIFSSGQDINVRFWDLGGKDLGRLALTRFPLLNVALSPQGKWFATAAEEKEVRIYDASSGKQLRVFQGHRDFVKSVAFSPTGQNLLTGSFDRTVRFWDVASARELACFSGHTREVACVAYGSDGEVALSGGLDSTIRLWDLQKLV